MQAYSLYNLIQKQIWNFKNINQVRSLRLNKVVYHDKNLVKNEMILLCLSGLNLKNNGKGSLQILMMPKLNEWAETSPNPTAKLTQQLCK